MDKKLSYILFTLFLSCILFVSCSNKDKTGSSYTMYVGNWYEGPELVMIVYDNLDISFSTIEKQGSTSKKVEGSGSYYTVTYKFQNDSNVILKITFNNFNNATVIISGSVSKTYYLVKE